MQQQNKPLMRSLMYLHMNQTTNGSRPPLIVEKPRVTISTVLSWVLVLMAVYFILVLAITNV